MIGYLDSSAASKLYLDDEGVAATLRDVMRDLDEVVTSRLTFVETHAALAAARRAGRFGAATHATAAGGFDRFWESVVVMDLDQAHAEAAAEAADVFGLRAGDAIQLAALRSTDPDGTMLVAWDGRLRAAATASGFACYPFEV